MKKDIAKIPAAVDAERAVLGSILASETAMFEAMDLLRPDDFYDVRNVMIWAACLDMAQNGKPPDLLLLCSYLESNNQLVEAGGASYVSDLASGLPDPGNVSHYASLVLSASRRRQLMKLGMKAISLASIEGSSAESAIDEISGALLTISSSRLDKATEVGPLAEDEAARIAVDARAGRQGTGVLTGFTRLDDLLGGFRPGQLVLLASRPGVGKTALALKWAETAAVVGTRVLYFSLEMADRELVHRSLARGSSINLRRLQRALLSLEDYANLEEAARDLKDLPLQIDDRTPLGLSELRARIRGEQFRAPVGLVVVDYLGLMEAPHAENRNQEVSKLSKGLKLMARQLDVPLLVLSQMSRNIEKRAPGETDIPQNSDLRDSGSLEQDADVILFIVRKTSVTDDTPEAHSAVRSAKLALTKNRQGPTGLIRMTYEPRTTTFLEAT
jgi:replicative DNA helicase